MADFDYDVLVKTLTLGDATVGKTSLVRRFCDNEFQTNTSATIGIDFKRKDLEWSGAKIRVQIWDTAGQHRFRTITPNYLKAAGGVVICFSVTDRDSFDGVSLWLQQISEHAGNDVKRVLIGNKMDLPEHRQVSEAEGRALATKHGIEYFEVSAKTGENVDRTFYYIVDLVRGGSGERPSQDCKVVEAKPRRRWCHCRPE